MSQRTSTSSLLKSKIVLFNSPTRTFDTEIRFQKGAGRNRVRCRPLLQRVTMAHEGAIFKFGQSDVIRMSSSTKSDSFDFLLFQPEILTGFLFLKVE